MSIYGKCLKECLNNCLDVHSSLFDSEELSYGNSFQGISLDGLLLLSKLLNRKYEWVRSDSLVKSFSYISMENTSVVLFSAINELLQLGIVETYRVEHQAFTWRILRTCLSSPEIKLIVGQLNIPNSSGASKDESIQNIYTKCKLQKTVFGDSLTNRLVKLINQVIDNSNKSLFDIGSDRSNYPGIIRLNPKAIAFLRRIQRLYNIAENSLEWKSGSLATSIRVPNPNNSDLLTSFGKIRFPRYSTSKCSLLFAYETDMLSANGKSKRMRAFHQWEAANELSSMYYEVCNIMY